MVKILIVLTLMAMMAESTIFVVTTGATVSALLGLKVVLLGLLEGVAIGAALGSSRGSSSRGRSSQRYYYQKSRWGRSAEDDATDETEAISNAILDASLNDAEDCAKKLVCSLNTQDINSLAPDESMIATLFGKSGSIDVSAVTAEFDLAALMGRNAGQMQCDTIYARCPYQARDLMEVMRQTNIPYHNQL